MEKMSLFNKYSFESEFVEVNEQVLKVYCKSKDKSFTVLIDTYGDPYMIYYYPLSEIDKEEEEDFRKQIFIYLAEKYPGYF